MLAHKEFRFLFPILPMAMHISGTYISSMCDIDPEDEDIAEAIQVSSGKQYSTPPLPSKREQYMRKKFVIIFLIVSNLPLALYTSLLHQRGTIDVMKYIHDEAHKDIPGGMRVMFLMPCHSTPYYA